MSLLLHVQHVSTPTYVKLKADVCTIILLKSWNGHAQVQQWGSLHGAGWTANMAFDGTLAR